MQPRRRSLIWFGGAVAALPLVCANAAFAQSCPTTRSPPPPIFATHTMPPYPALSQRLGEQGKVRLQVTIGTDGVPSTAIVRTSSGSQRLDDAAADWVQQIWRWQPLPQGCPNTDILVEVIWDLVQAQPLFVIQVDDRDYPPAARASREQGTVNFVVQMDQDNKVTRMTQAGTTGFADLDTRARALMGQHKFRSAEVDGQPAPSGLTVQFRFQLPPLPVPPQH